MLPFLTERFGNPSSVHFYGQEARAAVDRARREVASLINARPNEIVFLSGGTEANNLAVRGAAEASVEDGRAALRPDTILITVMLANNEIGTVQPVAEIGALVEEERARGRRHLKLHTDAVQAAGRMKVDVQ